MTRKKLLMAALLSFAFMTAYGIPWDTDKIREEIIENPLVHMVFPGVVVYKEWTLPHGYVKSYLNLSIKAQYNGITYNVLSQWNEVKAAMRVQQTASIEEELALYGQISAFVKSDVLKRRSNGCFGPCGNFTTEFVSVEPDSIVFAEADELRGRYIEYPHPYNYTIIWADKKDGVVQNYRTSRIYYANQQIIRIKSDTDILLLNQGMLVRELVYDNPLVQRVFPNVIIKLIWIQKHNRNHPVVRVRANYQNNEYNLPEQWNQLKAATGFQQSVSIEEELQLFGLIQTIQDRQHTKNGREYRNEEVVLDSLELQEQRRSNYSPVRWLTDENTLLSFNYLISTMKTINEREMLFPLHVLYEDMQIKHYTMFRNASQFVRLDFVVPGFERDDVLANMCEKRRLYDFGDHDVEIIREEVFEDSLVQNVFQGMTFYKIWIQRQGPSSIPLSAVVTEYDGCTRAALPLWNLLKAASEFQQTATIEEELLLFGRVKAEQCSNLLFGLSNFKVVLDVLHDSIDVLRTQREHRGSETGWVTVDIPSEQFNYMIITEKHRYGKVTGYDTLRVFYEDKQIKKTTWGNGEGVIYRHHLNSSSTRSFRYRKLDDIAGWDMLEVLNNAGITQTTYCYLRKRDDDGEQKNTGAGQACSRVVDSTAYFNSNAFDVAVRPPASRRNR
ncbi:MAG: hypothetical protein K8R90_11590 [Candidatus Cloacimonetes bacterium]|nr:hypothetical protein [Candidatus Cloacimonadota bacterium]